MSKIVIHLVYSLGGKGSVQRRAHLDAEVARAAGHEVVMATDRVAGPVPAGVKVVKPARLWHHRLPGVLRELGAMIAVHFTLARYLRNNAADVIVFHDSTLCWPALWNAGKRPTVYMVHALIRDRIESGANPYGALRTWLYRQANRYGLRHSSHVVCVSQYMAKMAIAEGADPSAVAVVPNLLDLTEFTTPHVAEYDVIYAGRLSVEKGVGTLITALKDLDPHLKVAIVGDGPQRGQLEVHAATSGLAACSFLGWVDRARLRALLATAAVQVVPSLSEPQGVVALEGLAAGTPVIAANVGGLTEMIEPETNGWLFPAGDAGALQRLLERVLSDRTTLAGMRERAKRSAQAFDLRTMQNRLERIYL
ncbi:glycosyltransferase family 4 protein [Dongia rigui]|uniref:Glycosyltransferase family 4 protein n=1 Tax=Dongia rigui TaxID=940149 RepID=A0ABU5E050_9PROT|nr:glycosyltransferase family 4 protein [Dongia rigui]MDY0872555.1 glycosyltransferase family 4 protein [Dongia rigui]